MWPLVFLLAFAFTEGLNPRIIGGKPTTISKHPYQVSIRSNGGHYCGGSIISRNWILTAAHCLYGMKASQFSVRSGSTYSNKGGVISAVNSIILHEMYDDDTFEYDVALIKLSSPITLNSDTKIVSLAKATTVVKTGKNTVVAGWGKTALNGDMSSVLRVLTLPVIDQAKCQKVYEYFNPVTPEMLCAGELKGAKDTCQGDSGGPLMYKGVQIGIVSWGNECAKPGYPGVYTRISAIRSWITKRANV